MIESILAICGGISIVGGAGVMIFRVIRPAYNINQRVADLERKANNDFEQINKLVTLNNAQSHAMIKIMNHMIDGNHVAEIQKTRDELSAAIITGK